MSDRRLPHHHTQPRPFHTSSGAAASRLPAYHSPYNTVTSTHHNSFQTPNRQAPTDPRFRLPSSMPDLSSLTSSALINALITPSAAEHEQQRRGFALATPFFNPRVPQAGCSRLFGDHDPHADPEDQRAGLQMRDQPRAVSDKCIRRQQKRKAIAQPEIDDEDDDYIDEAQTGDLMSPQGPRKQRRSNRSKKSPAPRNPPAYEENAYASPQRDTKPKRGSAAKKPKKERTGRLIRKKPIGMAVPKSLSEAGPADRMMWEWKNQGRNWEEIRAEWKKITGIEPGGSSLSVRYIKLVENLARNGAAGDIELLRFKREAEEELLSQLWSKVAEKMLAYSPESEYNPKDLQKRYSMIVRSGYDVEKLLAEDEIKREGDQTQSALPASEDEENQYEDGFDMTMQDISAYNDLAANEATSCVGQPSSVNHASSTDGAQYSQGVATASKEMANIFAATSILHNEVDGLNEQDLARDNHAMNTLMSSTTFLPTSPFASHKQDVDQEIEQCLAPAHSLIPYAYDSE